MASEEMPVPQGPAVPAEDDLLRGITTADWWVQDFGRPSSAAFRKRQFSVNIASRVQSMETVLDHLPDGSGVVSFGCQQARQLGYDPRDEPDPLFPENAAHAHVYFLGSGNQLRKAAARLALHCSTIVPPTFSSSK